MLTSEKAAAFDTLCDALTNRWSNGRWSWFPHTACGGPERETKEEAIRDLIEWSERIAAANRKKFTKS